MYKYAGSILGIVRYVILWSELLDSVLGNAYALCFLGKKKGKALFTCTDAKGIWTTRLLLKTQLIIAVIHTAVAWNFKGQ